MEAEPVLRSGIAATKVHVRTEETSVVRTASHISALVEEARLPDRVRRRALAVFGALAEAEGRLHRRPPEQVHFHEVGGLDAIVDVVGTCAALEVLEVDLVAASTVATGTGMIRGRPRPAPQPRPAVVELLSAVRAPTIDLDVGVELTTPTGAALLAALATSFGPMPAMVIERSGFGAGTRELDERPNATQVVLGQTAEELAAGQPVMLLEANVDDATGEVLAHTVSALLAAGAHDAWITPILMKKGRPAHTISALADVALAAQIAAVLTAETGSLGVRGVSLERWPAPRRSDVVEVAGMPIRVKVSPGRVKVEHDDAARVAGRAGLRSARSCRSPRRRAGEPLTPCPTPSRRLGGARPSPTTTTPRPRPRRAGACMSRPTPPETCEACRFDAAQYDVADALGTLRAVTPMRRQARGGPGRRRADGAAGARGLVRREYCAHSAETASVMAFLLEEVDVRRRLPGRRSGARAG